MAKEGVEQPKGRRAARSARQQGSEAARQVQNSHQGTELTGGRRGVRSVHAAYQPGGAECPG